MQNFVEDLEEIDKGQKEKVKKFLAKTWCDNLKQGGYVD